MTEIKQLIKTAEKLFEKEQYKKIIDLLPDTILAQYNNADLFCWRAWAHNRLKETESAFIDAEKAIITDPDNFFGYRQRGIARYGIGEYDKAIADYDKAIALKKDDAFAYYNKGLALYYKGEYEKSVSEYNIAIELKNDYAEAYSGRGLTWDAKGEYDKAIIDYNKAIELKKEYANAYYNRGNTFNNKGEYDTAIKDYDKAIELKNDNPDTYNNKGLSLYFKGEYDIAITNFNKAIKLKNDNNNAYNNRALSWNKKEEYNKAIGDYNTAIELDHNNANTFRNRGITFYNKGDFEKALEDFQKAIELDKKFNFLDYNIKLAKEKLEERKVLEESKAKQTDKDEKVTIEKDIEVAINAIKEVSRSKVKTVVHYTKVLVADIYVKNKRAKMHYSNAIYMNDPTEGKVFFDYLNDKTIEAAYLNGEKRTETSVYLGSFLPAEENDGKVSHEDELVMWRTYGKDENGKEAAGCSVVLSSDFFKNNTIKNEDPSVKDKPEELLNVVYIKNQKHQKKVTNDTNGKIDAAMKFLKEHVKKIIKLRNKYMPADDFYKDIENTIFKQLSTISYLFKSADYDFEHEVRIITYMPRNSDSIKYREITETNKPCKRFYIESYNDILPFVKKIYLGPKVEYYQQWSLYFDYEIRQRAKELINIIDTPYQIKASEIEIMKSENKFQ